MHSSVVYCWFQNAQWTSTVKESVQTDNVADVQDIHGPEDQAAAVEDSVLVYKAMMDHQEDHAKVKKIIKTYFQHYQKSFPFGLKESRAT